MGGGGKGREPFPPPPSPHPQSRKGDMELLRYCRASYIGGLIVKTLDNFWQDIDVTLALHSNYILSDDERIMIARKEQEAYESNIPQMMDVLNYFKEKLSERGFWTELQINESGLRFKYNKSGYYGPGGFSLQYHIAGPLVLAELNPKGGELAFFYKNDLDQNTEIGTGFSYDDFLSFIRNNILHFINAENLILSRGDYERLRNL